MSDIRQNDGMPFPRCYWVAPGLMAGCYPGADDKEQAKKKLKALLDVGIRHIINLMEPNEQNRRGDRFAPYLNKIENLASEMDITITFNQMPIKDMSVPSKAHMERILDLVDRYMHDSQPVYIHCWSGRGRTSTVVGCYLARNGYAEGQKALELIRDLRQNTEDHDQPSLETSEQIEMVLSWND